MDEVQRAGSWRAGSWRAGSVSDRRPARQQVGEGVALDELHGEEWPSVRQGAEVVDRRNRGVLELAGDARLVEEAPGCRRVDREAVLKELDRDSAIEGDFPGPINH